MIKYKTINLRLREEEWQEFQRLVDIYRTKVSPRLSIHIIAKALLEKGTKAVLETGI